MIMSLKIQPVFGIFVLIIIVLLSAICESKAYEGGYGYGPINQISLENVATNTSGPLKSEDVSEGPCFIDPPTQFLNPVFWGLPRTYYIPVGSEYAFRKYAELFLGRSANSLEELESMCLRLEMAAGSFITFGFGEYLRQTFAVPWERLFTRFDWSALKAYPDEASSFKVQKPLVADYTDILVLSDDQSFGMFARCVNGIKDFKVLTTTREVTDKVFWKIKEKAISMGFDGSKVQFLKCNYATAKISTSQGGILGIMNGVWGIVQGVWASYRTQINQLLGI